MVGAAIVLSASLSAQTVDRVKYPDYTDKRNPDYSLMQRHVMAGRSAASVRPDHVNNAETKFFPAVFNQDGGSCGSASRIGYMFTYELNAFRSLSADDDAHCYPTHFVWLLTNGNSGKDDFVQHVGVPSAQTYGGRTYSKLFGNQEESQDDFGWMTGYSKWHEAMFNRMLKPANFPENTGTEAGREALKNWLWNHNGDTSFSSGGVAGVGVAAGTMTCTTIGSTPTNDALGVTGKGCVLKWGTGVDHALTIVGYDDRIEFDLNGNGIYGETSADECGAWIIVNSWGKEWQNGGLVYCPYAYGGSHFNSDGTFSGNWWYPEIYKVRKGYKPQRTIKLKMDYSRRSELYLMAGVSANQNATMPDKIQAFDHFKYAGDGNNGNTSPAPEVPMLGRWADGKLHSEPMEFGYDLTDLSADFDENELLKYFFIINTKPTAEGNGHIYNASIIDYVQDSLGAEMPFDLGQSMEIQNHGKQTVISVVVPGRGVRAPQNVSVAGDTLKWSAPQNVALDLTGYKVLQGSSVIATLSADATSYVLPSNTQGTYGIVAVYDKLESKVVSAQMLAKSTDNKCVKLEHSGLTLPGVFDSKYNQATIEFWVRPLSLSNWNQSAGPGWGTFMFHANADGSFTAGWNTDSRVNAPSALKVAKWTHIAMVVKDSTLHVYVNGVEQANLTSGKYCGLGGFGDLVFSAKDENSDQNAMYDEIRIWKTARTADEIKDNYKLRYANGLLPNDLIAYYPGEVESINGNKCLCDYTANAHHGTFANENFAQNAGYAQSLGYAPKTEVHIVSSTPNIVAGQSTTLHALGSTNITSLSWSVPGTGIYGLSCASPQIIFKQSGEQNVKLVATNVNGQKMETDTVLHVAAPDMLDAQFKVSKLSATCGERITFVPAKIVEGNHYQWHLQGAALNSSVQPYVTTSYENVGTYKVTLVVTDNDGHSATSSQTIQVSATAPQADFDITPAVVTRGETVHLTDCSLYGSAQSEWTLACSHSVMAGNGSDISFRPMVAGVYDVTLKASNEVGCTTKTQKRALTICNADSKTGLNFMPSSTARLTLSHVPLTEGQKRFSIDWWMRPNSLQSVCNGIGDNVSTMQLRTLPSGQMALYISDKQAVSANDYVKLSEWHHYAVSYKSGVVNFFRDGEVFSTAHIAVSNLPALSTFVLGGDDAPICGMIDEFRVWNGFQFSSSNLSKLRACIVEPLTGETLQKAEQEGLSVYYMFNQSVGNAENACSDDNTGIRSGFGPDGDAWSSSKGVFALNFNEESENVTSLYLKNTEQPFSTTEKAYNISVPNRFITLSDWQENISTDGASHTGAHVDKQKDSDLTITTGWDGFDSKISDHKVYQTAYLPAGVYVFTAKYGSYEGQAQGCYLVAASADTLPNTADIIMNSSTPDVCAYQVMQSKGSVQQNSLTFVLTEPSKIALGILANMSGNQCMTISAFNLMQYPIISLNDLVQSVSDTKITKPDDAMATKRGIYDISGRRVNHVGQGVYIIDGVKIVK